jgi:hypothetical protein
LINKKLKKSRINRGYDKTKIEKEPVSKQVLFSSKEMIEKKIERVDTNESIDFANGS